MSNVVAFFAALAFGMADGARGAALVPLFLPFSIMVYADALPGAMRHRIIYACNINLHTIRYYVDLLVQYKYSSE